MCMKCTLKHQLWSSSGKETTLNKTWKYRQRQNDWYPSIHLCLFALICNCKCVRITITTPTCLSLQSHDAKFFAVRFREHRLKIFSLLSHLFGQQGMNAYTVRILQSETKYYTQKNRPVTVWHFAHWVKCKFAASLRLWRIEIHKKYIFNSFTSLWSTVQSGGANWLCTMCSKLLTYNSTDIVMTNLLNLHADNYTITVWMTVTVMRITWQEWASDCNDAWL